MVLEVLGGWSTGVAAAETVADAGVSVSGASHGVVGWSGGWSAEHDQHHFDNIATTPCGDKVPGLRLCRRRPRAWPAGTPQRSRGMGQLCSKKEPALPMVTIPKQTSQPESVGERELLLPKVLKDEKACADLLAFARGEYSAENIEFYLEVDAFMARWDTHPSEKERSADFDFMVEEFLTEGANRQVCIGDERVKAVTGSGRISKDVFVLMPLCALLFSLSFFLS